MQDGEAEALTRERISETARLLASALSDDPAYAFIFANTAKRRRGLEDFFTRHLGTHVPQRCTFVQRSDGGAVLATVTLRPPGGVHASRTKLARGIVAVSLAHGPGVIRRMFWVRKHYEQELEARTAGKRPYWHVHMMGVDPALQGKGIGSALLAQVLETAAREPAPIVLTTHQAINVRFYQRVGFRVTSEELVRPPATQPYTVWCMRRDPR